MVFCYLKKKNACFYLPYAGLKPGGETWFSYNKPLTLSLWAKTTGPASRKAFVSLLPIQWSTSRVSMSNGFLLPSFLAYNYQKIWTS